MSTEQRVDQELIFVNFNQNTSSLAIGRHNGYALYEWTTIDQLNKIHEDKDFEDAAVVERLFNSSLVTLVSRKAPRKLRVSHFQKGNEICTHSYTNTILSVRLNRKVVVVCLEESIYVHNIRDMKVIHTIRDTPPNPTGLIELTSDTEDGISMLAYPGAADSGQVHLFDVNQLNAVTMIPAHTSPLAALAFDAKGSHLATASNKGTVIRVFQVATGNRLFEFRRGVKRCVTIHSLAFSADSMFLCSASNTETIHVFKLVRAEDAPTATRHDDTTEAGEGVGAWMNYFSKTASQFLPAQMTDLLQREGSFATARLPAIARRNVIAMSTIATKPYMLVATTDGYLYIYEMPSEGGECSLVKQHRLGGSRDDLSNVNAASSASSSSTAAMDRLDTLRINDPNEFPPMSHATGD